MRTEIPVTEISRAGVAPPAQTDSDQTNGMLINSNNGNRIFVEIESTDAGDQTVSFIIPTLIDDEEVDPKVVTIPDGEIRVIGPFPTEFYNQADQSVWIDPSVDTTLKFRAYRLPSS